MSPPSAWLPGSTRFNGVALLGLSPAVIVRHPPTPDALCSFLPGGEAMLREGYHPYEFVEDWLLPCSSSAIIVVVLGLIVYTEQTNATQTVSVWVVTHDVTAGRPTALTMSSWFRFELDRRLQLRSGRSHHLSRAVRAKALVNDILRTDDLVPVTAQSNVAITVATAPPLVAGEAIDVFAAITGTQQVLIGHDLVVNSVSGSSVTLLVPVADEAAWVAIGASNVALHVALTVPGARVASAPLSADEAIISFAARVRWALGNGDATVSLSSASALLALDRPPHRGRPALPGRSRRAVRCCSSTATWRVAPSRICSTCDWMIEVLPIVSAIGR